MTSEDAKPDAARPGDGEHAGLPSIDFSTLVLSLATSAMVHMGLVPEAEGSPVEKNLALAHQSIDTLAMLQDKTRGNLSAEETKLLQSVLYELRMSYVKARDAKQ
jgi:hypothetical protein